MSDLFELADRVLGRLDPGIEGRVRVTGGTSALTRFANSRIHQNVAEDTLVVSLLVADGGRTAAGTTTRTDDAGLDALVATAVTAARLRPPDPLWPGPAPAMPLAGPSVWDEATAAAGPDARAEAVAAFVAAGAGLEAAGYCATDAHEVVLATTAGQRVSARATSAVIDGIHRLGLADGVGHAAGSSLRALDAAAAGASAATKARAGADPIELPPGSYPVILEPRCVADILQFFASSGFNAKAHLDGTSFVHLGEQQLDPSINLWDDATDPRTVGLPFDSEGTPRRRVDLVRGGVPVGLAHDRRTGAQTGEGSTGHAVGIGTFGAWPGNLFLGAGSTSVADMVASTERGLLVSDFWYTRILDPKTQVVTGLTRNGLFLIEGGEVVGPVANMRFTQSYVSALSPGRVAAIGDDARLTGSSHVPTLQLASWAFTGGASG